MMGILFRIPTGILDGKNTIKQEIELEGTNNTLFVLRKLLFEDHSERFPKPSDYSDQNYPTIPMRCSFKIFGFGYSYRFKKIVYTLNSRIFKNY